MKTKYKYRINPRIRFLIISLNLIFAGSLIATLLYGEISWSTLPLVNILWIDLMLFYMPSAKISERNVLSFRSYYIDIHKIISLKEDSRKGLLVRFIHLDREERSSFIMVSDSDRDRLISDLRSINQGIEICS